MRSKFLPFSPPLIGEEEIAEVVDTLRSDWITTGPKVARFEQEFAGAIGARSALAVSSCTAALHLALLSLGVGAGDAVITTTMTFCSTAHVIEHVGATPVLVDVEPDTLNIDPAQTQAAVDRLRSAGKRVRAIVPVHLYGHACDMNALVAVARENKLAIVEDAAHALPARYRGKVVGSAPQDTAVPVLTCFSFYATKNLTTAEGGMITGPPELIDDARVWCLHGMTRDAWNRYGANGSWFYEVTRAGFKYNMSDIQAALGIHQLRRLPSMYARRREIVEQYNMAFRATPELEIPHERPGVGHAWHLYVLRINVMSSAIERNEFIGELSRRNIGASVHFIPLHLHPYYRDKYGLRAEDFPIASREFERLVSLPLSPRMSDADVRDVIQAVHDIVVQQRNSTRVYMVAGHS